MKVTQPSEPIKIDQYTRIRKCETNLSTEDLRVGDVISVGPISSIEGLKISQMNEFLGLRIVIGKPKGNAKVVLETPFLAINCEQQIDSIGTLRVYVADDGASCVGIDIPRRDASRVSFTRYTPIKFSALTPGQVIAGNFSRSTDPQRNKELSSKHIDLVIEKTKER